MDRTHPDSPGYVGEEYPDWPDDLTALGPVDDWTEALDEAVEEGISVEFGAEFARNVGKLVRQRAETSSALTLPPDSAERKNYPLYRGLMRYFPAALAGVAKHSKEGNDKHNPGQELHHARGKSMDHEDCIMRHLMDLADLEALGADDEAILEEVNAIAWRALALSQELHEQYGGAPMAPGAEE